MNISHTVPPVKFTQRIPSAVSLFSGCGGFCEGIEQAGFNILVSVEIDKYACQTYRKNFPKTPLFEGDVHDFLKPDSTHIQDYRLNAVDLVFGGPPCQGFSQIGSRDINDPRNELYKQFCRIVDTLKPKVFVMENVPNLALMNKGAFKKAIIERFGHLGYSNTTMIKLSADEFGVPQSRQRVFFLGTRDGLLLDTNIDEVILNVLERQRVNKPVTVGEALFDLPDAVVPSGEVLPYPEAIKLSQFMKEMRLDQNGKIYSKRTKTNRGIGRGEVLLYNHHTKEIQEKRAYLISLLEQGKKADSLPKDIWNNKRPEKWRRLNENMPSHTILAQMHRDLSEWIHPRLNRWITVREAARLQSFHDGFIFVGSEWQQLKQIGNAVPPLLGFVVALISMELINLIHKIEENA